MTMNEDLTKNELLARLRTLESKLEAIERNRHAAIEDHRSQSLREISSGISHNLNNLLTGMLLQAELIESATTDPEILECVQDIIRTGRRGADLVARLGLALRENVRAVPHPTDLKTAIEEGVENSRAIWEGESTLEGRRIVLTMEVADDLPSIMATESDLIDLVIDLVKNANEALPEGGAIRISAKSAGKFVRLSIQDDGIGMEPETLRRATSPFFTTKSDVGSGLGLSTIEGLVKTWGGKLDLVSTLGNGTTVLVEFPTAD